MNFTKFFHSLKYNHLLKAFSGILFILIVHYIKSKIFNCPVICPLTFILGHFLILIVVLCIDHIEQNKISNNEALALENYGCNIWEILKSTYCFKVPQLIMKHSTSGNFSGSSFKTPSPTTENINIRFSFS